uniref:AB hydrolase-1 domain-containing protein n=1 Tax=Helicotheca tamesis TaxID=374047 RepID=A0A7S2HXY1_9STRA|mmetsp:Transcript_3859/g.5191  ORF Transcript_3859/g.5191 Transcript_3859/m.5191 type:complete len:370 (+) Transcript_3859:75-1184(+)
MPPNQGLCASTPFVLPASEERKDSSVPSDTPPRRPRPRRRRILSGGFGPCTTLSFLIGNTEQNEGYTAVRRTYVPSTTSSDGASQEEKKQDMITRGLTLYHKIFRPSMIDAEEAGAPIVVLHGGPSIPSDYLYPLVEHVPSNRAIVFFDQLGCGKSSMPDDINAYSIKEAVNDLEVVLKNLGIRRFHLYGHSYGGIVAFEYIKRIAEREACNESKSGKGCLSMVLSSAPFSIKMVEEETEALLDSLRKSGDDASTLEERFRINHQCRTPHMPAPLIDAYKNAGTVWRDTAVIQDYVATPPSKQAAEMPPVLAMRGEHDFVTDHCVSEWKSVFDHDKVNIRTLEGCSHHGLLERGSMYGGVLNDFFSEHD